MISYPLIDPPTKHVPRTVISKTKIEDYGLGKLKRVQGHYAQIQMMMQKKFLPDLEKVTPTSIQDKLEKDRLNKFFKDNNTFFDIFLRFSNSMHTTVQDELRIFLQKHLS